MSKASNLPPIDIHWTICNPDEAYHFNICEIWQSSQTEIFFEETALVLSPEDLILHICHHASYHHTLDIGALRFSVWKVMLGIEASQ